MDWGVKKDCLLDFDRVKLLDRFRLHFNNSLGLFLSLTSFFFFIFSASILSN